MSVSFLPFIFYSSLFVSEDVYMLGVHATRPKYLIGVKKKLTSTWRESLSICSLYCGNA